jgi:hypothetical protein
MSMKPADAPMKRYPHPLPSPLPVSDSVIEYLLAALSYQNQLLADLLSAVTALAEKEAPEHSEEA